MGRRGRRERQEDAARAAAQETERAILGRVEETFSRFEPPEAYRLHDAGDVDLMFRECTDAINELPREAKEEALSRLLAKVFYLSYERQRTKFTGDPEGAVSELIEKRDTLGELLARDHARTNQAKAFVDDHWLGILYDIDDQRRGVHRGDPGYMINRPYSEEQQEEAEQRLVDMQKWLIPAHADFYRDWLEGYMRQGGSVTWREQTFEEYALERPRTSFYVAVHNFENLSVAGTIIIVPEGIRYEQPLDSRTFTFDMNSYDGPQGRRGEVIGCTDTIPRGFERVREEALRKETEKGFSVERMLHEFDSEPSEGDDA